MAADHLSLNEARRIALAAQGFDRPRPARPGLDDIRRVIHQLGLLQIDYVNVLLPAHYQVLFSRLGPYDRSRLDYLIYQRREFIEQWAHEASIVPVDRWPLLRYRRDSHRPRPWGFEEVMRQNPDYVRLTLEDVRARGPLTADQLQEFEGVPRKLEGSWFGSVSRAMLEAHFGSGLLAIANRLPNFARTYDLAERIVAAEHHGRSVAHEDAQRELLGFAARAHGIGTVADLADYYRMPVLQARPRIAELVDAGVIREVRVEGWKQTAYLHNEASRPASIKAASLLSPFDPLVWFRDRLVRLFDFDFRFEIFVPQEKRRWGVYVLPFLLGDRLVARVDLRADRDARRLIVAASYLETAAEASTTAAALAVELRSWAAWLGLDTIKVGRKGNFARALAAALRV
jgi:uncharacterized protein